MKDPRQGMNDELEPLVIAEFSVYDPSPLGLVISWDSPAGPTIIRVEPGPAADQRKIQPGFVLKEVNFQSLSDIDLSDNELENLLLERPLTLGFRRPPESMATHGELRRVRQALKEARQTEAVAKAALEKLRTTKKPPPPPRQLGYFEVHPERAPLSRYGTLELCPPHLRKTSSEPYLHHSREGDKLRLPSISGSRNQSDGKANPWYGKTNLPANILPISQHSMSNIHMSQSLRPRNPLLTGNPHNPRHIAVSGNPHSHLGPMALGGPMDMTGGALPWHGVTLPCARIGLEKIKELDAVCGPPDLSYEHLVEGGKLSPFAEGDQMLPVCHEGGYKCRLHNFEQAYKILDAYDPGFRAQKRETIDPLRYANVSPRLVPRKAVPEKIEEIVCDSCGLLVVKKKAQKRYYYCHECKIHGRRYELCPVCYDREAHQGENRFCGPGVHPHYKYCYHQCLILYKCIANAYPQSPGILRALCDHCGKVICSRGDQDARLIVCTTCRDQFGLRFEICVSCFTDLHQKGWSPYQ